MTTADDHGKEAFLGRVREALGRAAPLVHTPDHPSLKTHLSRQEEKVRTIQARIEARRPQMLMRLMERAAQAGWQTKRVPTHKEAAQAVAEVVRAQGAHRVMRTGEELLERLELDTALRAAGAVPRVLAPSRGRPKSALRTTAMEADMGISGVEYAIAETGSCVVSPGRRTSRLVSLTPPVYIALVEPEQVLESLDDLLALRRLEHLRGRGTPYMNLISGPSRTADIEQTLTIGVHGPGQVYLVLIG